MDLESLAVNVDSRVIAVDEMQHRLPRQDAAGVGGEGDQASTFHRRQWDQAIILPDLLAVEVNDHVLPLQTSSPGQCRFRVQLGSLSGGTSSLTGEQLGAPPSPFGLVATENSQIGSGWVASHRLLLSA